MWGHLTLRPRIRRRLYQGQALDDRAGAPCSYASGVELHVDCTLLYVRGVGTRGAFGAAFSESPDMLCGGGATAADLPPASSKQVWPGEGP
jgi:hypothetical protein